MNISVIIPVYNVERYVERCLLSIINQTYTESVECIVVNDCTPDNSMKIVEKLVADYKGSIQFKLLCHNIIAVLPLCVIPVLIMLEGNI